MKGIISIAEGSVSRTAFYSEHRDNCCSTQLSEVLGHCRVKDIFWGYSSHFLYNFMFLYTLNAHSRCVFMLLTDFITAPHLCSLAFRACRTTAVEDFFKKSEQVIPCLVLTHVLRESGAGPDRGFAGRAGKEVHERWRAMLRSGSVAVAPDLAGTGLRLVWAPGCGEQAPSRGCRGCLAPWPRAGRRGCRRVPWGARLLGRGRPSQRGKAWRPLASPRAWAAAPKEPLPRGHSDRALVPPGRAGVTPGQRTPCLSEGRSAPAWGLAKQGCGTKGNPFPRGCDGVTPVQSGSTNTRGKPSDN